VKELKGPLSLVMVELPLFTWWVESGEGIESCRPAGRLVQGESEWNPVKELKDSTTFR